MTPYARAKISREDFRQILVRTLLWRPSWSSSRIIERELGINRKTVSRVRRLLRACPAFFYYEFAENKFPDVSPHEAFNAYLALKWNAEKPRKHFRRKVSRSLIEKFGSPYFPGRRRLRQRT